MFKKLLDVRLQNLIQYTPEVTNNVSDLEFVSNYQAIQVTAVTYYLNQNTDLICPTKPPGLFFRSAFVTRSAT